MENMNIEWKKSIEKKISQQIGTPTKHGALRRSTNQVLTMLNVAQLQWCGHWQRYVAFV